MSEKNHDELREALAAYALGALDPQEATELEGHVEGCAACREELVWLTPAVRMLPEAVDQHEPPPRLRERVMAEVEADAARPAAAERYGRPRRWLPARGLRPLAAGLAAVLAAVAVATAFLVEGGEDEGPSNTVVAASGVTAKLIRHDDGGTLELDHVSEVPPQHVLQAWVQRGREVESAGVFFLPDEEGKAVAALDHLDGARAVMVTVEPRGGSEAPTTKPIAAVGVPEA